MIQQLFSQLERYLWLAVAGLLLSPNALLAQPAPLSPATESKPDTYYLKDADGKLVPVLDFSYEDFKRLYDLDKNLESAANSPPAYSLQSLSIQGRSEEGHARLTVACKILVKKEGWVRIPLRFPAAILREAPQWDGPGTQFTDYDRDGDGYVFWVNGQDDKPHNLKLELLSTLRRNGEEVRVSFNAPRATVSEMQFQVTGGSVTPRINETSTLAETTHPAPNQTVWKILGVGGDFQLAWNEGATAKMVKSAAVLEARGGLLVRVEGRRRITSEAKLKVASFGGPIESFRVRLPPNMELLPLNEIGYSVTTAKETIDDDGLVVREVAIELDNKTATSIDVRLKAVLPTLTDATSPLIQTCGFEVLGAVSQFGVIDIAVDGDWNVSWVEGANVHRLDELPELQRQQKVVARFEYDRQPCSLKVNIQPRKTHLSVEPRHVVQVSAERLTLETALKCRIRGARAESIEIDLDGWKVDQILPDKLVQIELLNLDSTQPLSIPLSTLAAGMSEFELKIIATREIDAKDTSVSFSLPHARASAQTPATIVVLPNDNVELTPRSSDIQGLIAETDPPSLTLPARQQAPLFYRDRGGVQSPKFVADRKVHSRTLAAMLSHRFQIDRTQVDRTQVIVEQRFHFRVAYEPLKSVLFTVPAELLDDDNIQFFWEIAPQQLVPLETEIEDTMMDATEGGNKRRIVRVFLGEDRIGSVNLLARFKVSWEGLERDRELNERVPLVRLAADEKANVISEALHLIPATGIDARVTSPEWQRVFSDDNNSADEPQFTCTAKPLTVPLVMKLTRPLVSLATTIHKTWVQTWLTDDWRHDRVVFAITTSEKELEFQLPVGTQTDGLVAAMNGHSINFMLTEANRVLKIGLPERREGGEFVIELSYLLPYTSQSLENISIEFPRPLRAATTSFFRWHLKTKSDNHLVGSPRNLTPELSWRWRPLFWDRRSSLSQHELEQWIGASPQAAIADADTNQYLFDAFGEIEQTSIRTASRGVIVLLVSGCLLFVGTLILYFPFLRHPQLLVVLLLILSAALFMAPEFMLLASQAGLLGAILLVVTWYLRLLVIRRGAANTVVRATPLSVAESKGQAIRFPRVEGSSYATTATAAAPQTPLSTTEPKS